MALTQITEVGLHRASLPREDKLVERKVGMKKNIIFGLVALIVCIGSFFAGIQTGASHTEQQHQLRDSYLDVVNAIAAYSIQADVAQAIENKKETRALCLVQVQASAQVNKVRACLETSSCRQMIEAEVLKIAPELLGQGELKVKYYKEGELCKP